MNARDQAHRTTMTVTTGLAAAALATTLTVGLVVARTENAGSTDGSDTDSTGGVSGSTGQSSTDTQDRSTSGTSGSAGISPGRGSADATSGGS